MFTLRSNTLTKGFQRVTSRRLLRQEQWKKTLRTSAWQKPFNRWAPKKLGLGSNSDELTGPTLPLPSTSVNLFELPARWTRFAAVAPGGLGNASGAEAYALGAGCNESPRGLLQLASVMRPMWLGYGPAMSSAPSFALDLSRGPETQASTAIIAMQHAFPKRLVRTHSDVRLSFGKAPAVQEPSVTHLPSKGTSEQ
ncbi:uncharacterized protein PAN0_017d5514 [Moesziomyces antarcticus]|uniref:Uncharacterized protein n=2 Tax=Pseudozyma antarctica TaxID=84753 RepID=A0A081CKU1_PSEA2|nr:uncharacterized protein PAN0_017d5514 [Moesziomyces antarcticus]GAK67287.1 hypothetical protein PAN0_017d5514 [Moesziomyces antarcticus]SPO48101.1 uncharacterized protein PSANT_05789 [Moesziomyces antarcticus]